MGHPVSSCEMSRFQQVSVSLDDDFAGETWARSQAMRLKSLISMVDAVGIEPTTLPVMGALSSSCIGDDAMKFTSRIAGCLMAAVAWLSRGSRLVALGFLARH